MRTVATVLCLALVASCALAEQNTSGTSRTNICSATMTDLSQGKFSSVTARFNPQLKQSLAPEQLQLVWNKVVSIVGPFQEQISQAQRTVQGAPVYIVKSRFQKAKAELRLFFDDSDQISGIYLVPISDASPDTVTAAAKAAIDLLRQKRFSDLEAKFTDDMKAQLPSAKLEGVWNQVTQQSGEFKSIKLAQKDPEFDVVDTRCTLQKGEVNIRVAFDPFLNVAGLWITPAQ
jgi:hypothetical protein